jgi:hypothetical protein
MVARSAHIVMGDKIKRPFYNDNVARHFWLGFYFLLSPFILLASPDFEALPSVGKAPLKVEFKATDNVKAAFYSIEIDDPIHLPSIAPKTTCDQHSCTTRGAHTFYFNGVFTVKLIKTVPQTCSEERSLYDEEPCFPKRRELGELTVIVSGGPAEAKLQISPTKGEDKIESKITVTGFGGPFVVDFGNGQDSKSESFYLPNKNDSWTTTQSYLRTGFATNDNQKFQVQLFTQNRLLDEGQIELLPSVKSRDHKCQVAEFQFLTEKITKEEKIKACN